MLPMIAELAEIDPLRAEALLHAFPPVLVLPEDEWATEFLSRWKEVRKTMSYFECEGLATPISELGAIADRAYALATQNRHGV